MSGITVPPAVRLGGEYTVMVGPPTRIGESMTYCADLTRGDVTVMGYLAHGHDFPEGETSEAVFDRLASLVMLHFVCWMGYHYCDLGECRSNQPQPDFFWRGMKIPRCCSTDILVPGKAELYMAPALILHYIRTHRYLPPACFLEAVLECPEPGSAEYWDAIGKAAPNFWNSRGWPARGID